MFYKGQIIDLIESLPKYTSKQFGHEVVLLDELKSAVADLVDEDKFDWCQDCKEYDHEKHCCHQWSSFIGDTVREIQENKDVVLCKDCEYCDTDDCAMDKEHFPAFEYDYCSKGVKRE